MLELYNQKRDFKQTPEPTTGKRGEKNSFVVQWHDATRLHYDFRLEVGGVLKSWAVPKGPSLSPKDKRLAIMVEDHPLDYQFFEGIIPAGNYGAGEVRIWDKGTYQFLSQNNETIEQAIDKGDLKFEINGDILKGSFALFRLKNSEKGNEWLLVKHKDEFATTTFTAEKPADNPLTNKSAEQTPVKEKLLKNKTGKVLLPKVTEPPIALKPMSATLGSGKETLENFIFEKKYDGYRCVAVIHSGEAKLYSRNQIDITTKYISIMQDLEKLSQTMILDGEIVSEKDGKENFQAVANGDSPFIKFMVFDLLHLEGQDLCGFELYKRQDLLKTLFENNTFKKVFISEVIEDRTKIENLSIDNNWEGFMAKKRDGLYYPNKRSDGWIKIKNHQGIEAVICGFSAAQGDRNYFGSLVLGIEEDGEWKYLGNCGTGFDEEKLRTLFAELKPRIVEASPFKEKVRYRTKLTWVKPELVCEVKYAEYTEDHKLRHPVFLRLRADKSANEVDLDSQLPEEVAAAPEPEVKPAKHGKKIAKNANVPIITNPDKVYWPADAITKGDLIHYYEIMAEYLLPYLHNHPISLNRHPNGIDHPNFFQKNMDLEHLPAWVKTVPVHSDSKDGIINYMLCNDAESLVYMANLGCIEINAWLSTITNLDYPEFVLIDLDPGEIDFKYVVDVALEVRGFLTQFQLNSYIKTSGSTGLHIYIPTAGQYDFDATKQFAEWVATSVQQKMPKTTSVERAVKNRTKKIYIDFLQNRSAQTVAVPFSVRPKPGATVSFPLHWEQVTHKLKMSDYRINNVPELVKKWDNPWQDILNPESAVDLSKIFNI